MGNFNLLSIGSNYFLNKTKKTFNTKKYADLTKEAYIGQYDALRELADCKVSGNANYKENTILCFSLFFYFPNIF